MRETPLSLFWPLSYGGLKRRKRENDTSVAEWRRRKRRKGGKRSTVPPSLLPSQPNVERGG